LEYEPSLHWNVAPAGAPPAAVEVLAELVVLVVVELDVLVEVVFNSWATPPWAEQRPRELVAVEYVPSLHLAVALAGACAARRALPTPKVTRTAIRRRVLRMTTSGKWALRFA
jgi:hypothetical protein